MKSLTQYIEENLFGCNPPSGTGQENYDGFIDCWGKEGLIMENGYEITPQDIQVYIDDQERLNQEKKKQEGCEIHVQDSTRIWRVAVLIQDPYFDVKIKEGKSFTGFWAVAKDCDDNEYLAFWECTEEESENEKDIWDNYVYW